MTIVSFSGIDGAGKSTQIRALQTWLTHEGLSVQLLTFWDDVVVFPRWREFMSHAAFKGDQGIGSPERPLQRRDKNVTTWPVCALRFGLYFLDAINLYQVTQTVKRRQADVVIFDRYIYDELANLPIHGRLAQAFVRMLLKLAPKPDIAYLLDADPTAALARKPEYPLEFLHSNRRAYLNLSRLTDNISVIEPQSIEAMEIRIKGIFLQNQPGPEGRLSGLPAVP